MTASPAAQPYILRPCTYILLVIVNRTTYVTCLHERPRVSIYVCDILVVCYSHLSWFTARRLTTRGDLAWWLMAT